MHGNSQIYVKSYLTYIYAHHELKKNILRKEGVSRLKYFFEIQVSL